MDASPPPTADLEAMGREDLARPEAFDYTETSGVLDPKTSNKRFSLFPRRTEYRIRHEVIKDASGPHQPAATDPKYWGESDYDPPAATP